MPRVRLPNLEQERLLVSPSWPRCEAWIKAFEDAWARGQPPSLRDFIQVDGDVRRALLVELVHVDLEFRYKTGQSLPIEQYFQNHRDLLEDRHAAVELIVAEFQQRRQSGAAVHVEEYCARFPEYRTELVGLLAQGLSNDEVPTLPGSSLLDSTHVQPTIPGYDILEEVGRGGMGLVYKAVEIGLGRLVALKVLPADYAHDPERLERFIREARTASALNHPHICTVHALGDHQGCPFIVMEFIEGQTLRVLFDRQPGWQESCRLIRQAARALAAAHQAAVVHRDIKPENIMVRSDGYVKVLDFGLARRLPRLGNTEPAGDTDPGALLGTVAYMSPEQAHGIAVEAPSDIFSLGIVLYQLVTGRHPFEGRSNLGILSAIANEEPVAARRLNPDLPAALEGLIGAMLHKDARLRPTAEQVEALLVRVAASPSAMNPSASTPRAIVHREPELAMLRRAQARAEAGEGTVVCVVGEPGIGKTTLIEDFLAEGQRQGVLVGRGNCSERRADTEAYLPVLDALEDLLRKDSSGTVRRLMQVVAPTWYAQIGQADRMAATMTEAPVRASSQQAMLRELRTLLQEISRVGTVMLFLDDVHWADVPTVDLIAHLGHHARGLRVLVLATSRSTELLLGPHPFHLVRQELCAKGVCLDLPLGFLRRSDIDRYLELAFPGHQLPADFADLIYARTEGSPLFMVDLLRYLRERGVVAEVNGRWRLVRDLPDLRQELPESVRSVIQRKLQWLGEEERRLLSAASVQGHEFDSAALAAALKMDPIEVEERLQNLDQVHGLIRLVREHEFPDGAISLRYAFVHILYQQALYGDLQPARRAALSLALARTLEAHQPENVEHAAELACLYEAGRDLASAARQFWRAANNAARVFAHREAITLARRGLRLLTRMPTSAERVSHELPLLTILGLHLQVTRGFADPEAREVYTRARELCVLHPDAAASFPVLWGLWLYSKVRSELPRAQEMAEQLLTLARKLNDPDLALQAHQALGITAFCRGALVSAIDHVEQASALYDPRRHRTHSFLFGQDPGVICKAFGAVGLWLLGFPDQAVQQSELALRMSQDLSPSSQTVALHFAAMLHQMRGDVQATLTTARRSCVIAAEHGLSFWLAGGTILEGWAMAAGGSLEEGLSRLQGGIHDWLATQSVTYHTYHLGLLAEVLAWGGRGEESQRILKEAFALVDQTEERFVEPELHRLHARILLQQATEAGPGRNDLTEQAGESLRLALVTARRQQARSLELRITLSMVEAQERNEICFDARRELETAYQSFREGFDTPDLQRAKALLKE